MTPLTIKNIKKFRKNLKLGKVLVGGWMQLSNSNLAAGDWERVNPPSPRTSCSRKKK